LLGVPEMDVFKKDLEAAKIPLIDAQGRRVDFHALRHTLCTNLARAGVNPWLAMSLMRHSDIKLTTRTYTDAGRLPTREAVGRLPDFFPMEKPDPVNDGEIQGSHLRSQRSGFSGQSVSHAVTVGINGNVEQNPVNIDLSHGCHLLSIGVKK